MENSQTKFKETELELIPKDWDVFTIPDIAENFDTKRAPLSSRQRAEMRGPYPYYGATGVLDYLNDYKLEGSYLLIAEDGTVTVDGKRPMLQRVSGKFWVSNHAHILKCKSDQDQEFLFYQLSATDISPYITGAVQLKLSQANLNKIPILWPQKKEDRKEIAEVLGALDEKIELNRRMNKTLDSLARAVFKKWFIDDADPNWEMSTIGKELETFLGGTPSREISEYWNGDIPWINSGKVNEDRIIEPSEYITEQGLNKSAAKLLPKGTTVLAITGATLGQYSLLEIDSCFNQSVVGIKESPILKKEYIYYWISETINDILGSQTGGAQQHINKQVVESHEILIPDGQTLEKYYKLANPLFDQITDNYFQIRTLSQIRDSLLPRLMSGKLRVK